MPNQHRHTPISYRPSADLRARLEAFSERTGRPVRAVITEALDRFLLATEQAEQIDWSALTVHPAEQLAGAIEETRAAAAAELGYSPRWYGEPGDPARPPARPVADVAERAERGDELAAAVAAVTVCECGHPRDERHMNARGRCIQLDCPCRRYKRQRG